MSLEHFVTEHSYVHLVDHNKEALLWKTTLSFVDVFWSLLANNAPKGAWEGGVLKQVYAFWRRNLW